MNNKLKIPFLVRYLVGEKAISYYKKYRYNLEWNYLAETANFRGLL
jgi:hypothetical protein